jgi:hypothetical protein
MAENSPNLITLLSKGIFLQGQIQLFALAFVITKKLPRQSLFCK